MPLYQATTSYFCAGLYVNPEGKIVDSAPILHWSIGKHVNFLESWLKRKGGSLNKVK